MAHEVESMFYRGETPWHGLGVRCSEAPNTEEAIRLAGLDWDVGFKQLKTPDGEIADHRFTYRMSDGRKLGEVGPNYEIFQNRDAFCWFEPYLSSGEAKLETAGSLRNGRYVWILAELTGDPIVVVPRADDIVRRFLILAHAHDGTLATNLGYTPTRVVCQNTLSAALHSKTSTLLRVRHTRRMKQALAQVRDIMNLANRTFEATGEQYRQLARKGVVEADLRRYVNMVFRPQKAAARASTAMVLASQREIIDAEFIDDDEPKDRIYPKVHRLFVQGRGNQLPGVAGTMWAAYNAVTEYLSYERGKDVDIRVGSNWFGDAADINRRALSVAVQMAA
ncbi:DUF932 domain-containing protein [Pendulispora brunnea]|uniref:DUF932 domain-containing protein n=1 Tax=Pendulispora brunnea TaxID=2905690 RepID=A0ABZ2KDK5_9BACT